jgi:hypothetical protein
MVIVSLIPLAGAVAMAMRKVLELQSLAGDNDGESLEMVMCPGGPRRPCGCTRCVLGAGAWVTNGSLVQPWVHTHLLFFPAAPLHRTLAVRLLRARDSPRA